MYVYELQQNKKNLTQLNLPLTCWTAVGLFLAAPSVHECIAEVLGAGSPALRLTVPRHHLVDGRGRKQSVAAVYQQ